MSHSATPRSTPLQRRFGGRTLAALIATTAVAFGVTLSQPALADGPRHGAPGAPGAMAAGPGLMGPGAFGLLGHPRMADRVLDRIQATPAQRSQVQQLLKGAADEARADREAGRELAQQAATLFAQPTVDANAAEALRQQMLVRADATSRRATQLMLELSRVLTPEQRAQLVEQGKQRREKLEQHHKQRAERGQQRSTTPR